VIEGHRRKGIEGMPGGLGGIILAPDFLSARLSAMPRFQ
jgi:hypothetical protein